MSIVKLFIFIFILVTTSITARAGIIDQSFTSATGQGAMIGRTYDGLAQTFTVGVSGIFDSAELLLSQTSVLPTSDLTISLLDTSSAGLPTTSIASVTIASADVSGTPGVYLPVIADFSFADYSVSDGDILALAISSTSEYAWNAGVDENATYTDGQRYSDFTGGGVSWDDSAFNSDWDFSFQTTVTTAVPEPSILFHFGAGLLGLGFAHHRKHKA